MNCIVLFYFFFRDNTLKRNKFKIMSNNTDNIPTYYTGQTLPWGMKIDTPGLYNIDVYQNPPPPDDWATYDDLTGKATFHKRVRLPRAPKEEQESKEETPSPPPSPSPSPPPSPSPSPPPSPASPGQNASFGYYYSFGAPVRVEARKSTTSGMNVPTFSFQDAETKVVEKRPSQTHTPEQLKSEEGRTVYVVEDGKGDEVVTEVWPPASHTTGNNVILANGEVLDHNSYMNRGVELVYHSGSISSDLCGQILALKFANIPASNTRVGSCSSPFCLCQLSVDQIRNVLTQLNLDCVNEAIKGSPNKDTLCRIFELLRNAGLLEVDYPFENYYTVESADPFFLLDDDDYYDYYYDDDPYDYYYDDFDYYYY
jgi:hypothetical protein